MYVCIHIYIYIYTYTHVYIHYIYIYIYVYRYPGCAASARGARKRRGSAASRIGIFQSEIRKTPPRHLREFRETPPKSSWIFSGIFQRIFSGVFQHTFTWRWMGFPVDVPMDCLRFSNGTLERRYSRIMLSPPRNMKPYFGTLRFVGGGQP